MEEVIRSVSVRIPDKAQLGRDERLIAHKKELLQRMFGEQLAKELPTDGTPVMVRALREEKQEPWDRTTIISIHYELRQAHTMNHVVYEPPPVDLRIPVADSIGPFLQAITREVNQLANEIKQCSADLGKAQRLQSRVLEYKQVIGKATEQLQQAVEMAEVAAGAAAAIKDYEVFGDLLE
jgi:hypothetical protein